MSHREHILVYLTCWGYYRLLNIGPSLNGSAIIIRQIGPCTLPGDDATQRIVVSRSTTCSMSHRQQQHHTNVGIAAVCSVWFGVMLTKTTGQALQN